MARYTYGDSALAGDRLELVARLFEPASRAFLVAAGGAPEVAVDLGSGPGATTALLADVTRSQVTIGVERSIAFARRARQRRLGRIVVADVAASHLPIGRAALLYARLLLAHLADPAAAVARWSTILTIGGRVLIDDLERIETGDDVFNAYLDEVALAVVRAEGGALFVGPILHRAADPAGLRRVHDEVATFAPPAGDTATVFGMNLEVLTHRGEIEPRPQLAHELRAIAEGRRPAERVRWHLRQLAWERTG
jgi:trans-aconitate 2-methyltransferase